MSLDIFSKRLITSTQALLNNQGKKSNADYFMDYFTRGYEGMKDEIWTRFLTFYATEFEQFKQLIKVPKGLQDVFQYLRQEKLILVSASNPVWPKHVQMQRMAWAGLESINFKLIAHMENMTFCKPKIEFYNELCVKLNIIPEACLMIGNDPINDMTASRIGMKTYLTTDSIDAGTSSFKLSRVLRNNKKEEEILPDFIGPISNVPKAIDACMR